MLNIDQKHKDVLHKIVSLFDRLNIGDNWIIAGGVAQKINGLVIETKDIDILTDTDTAFLMNKALEEYAVNPMKVSENDRFRSAFGQYSIGDVPVEIAGDLHIKGSISYNLFVTPFVLENSMVIKINSKNIYIEPLEESLIADIVLERHNRVSKIVDCLKKRNINWEYIEIRLSGSNNPKLLKEKIYDLF